MSKCSDMKKGDIFTCGDCGLELQVVAECTDDHQDQCCCDSKDGGLNCCGKPLAKK